MKASPLLAWNAQVAAHAAFVAAHASAVVSPPGRGKRTPTTRALANRQRLLAALGDGRRHRLDDIAARFGAALSRQGVYQLLEVLINEGRVASEKTGVRCRFFWLI